MKNYHTVYILMLAACASASQSAADPSKDFVIRFGMNASESLLNPAESPPNSSEIALQTTLVVHDLKSMGGGVLRWMPTEVWPQWRCGNDPEDAAGQIDPNWFAVATTLLQAAQREGVKVVVTLSDLTNNSFGGVGTDPAVVHKRLDGWAEHRMAADSKDGYLAHSCGPGAPYYERPESELFTDPELRARFARRLSAMARFLADFPALGAIELFNEPDFPLTHSPEYWRTVAVLLRAVKDASPALADTPVFSGTAAWDAKIVSEAQRAGALDLEPFLTVHAYDDYTLPEAELDRRLDALVDYLRRLAPGKPVIIAEAGSRVPLRRLEDNAKMIRVLLRIYRTRHIGLWVWGNWFPSENDVDYKSDFNPRSAAGPSLAPYFFASEMTQAYITPHTVAVDDPASGRRFNLTFAVEKIEDQDPRNSGVWSLRLDGRRFIGFSRAGAFPKRGDPPELFAAPPPTFFITDPGPDLRWAAITEGTDGWTLKVFACDASNLDTAATPTGLLGLAVEQERHDFLTCSTSKLLIQGRL